MLKVYGTSQYFKDNVIQCRAIVATKTKKKAAELLRQSVYTFKNYTCETGNAKEIELAMAKPETVIIMERYR